MRPTLYCAHSLLTALFLVAGYANAQPDSLVAIFARVNGTPAEQTLSFLKNDNDVVHRISLGRIRGERSGVWSPDAHSFWYTTNPSGGKDWFLTGVDPELGTEVARLNVGRRMPYDPKYQRTWSEWSEDGKHLFVLANVRGTWHINIYQAGKYDLVEQIELDKGMVTIEQLANSRLLIVSEHPNSGSGTRLMIAAPTQGELIFRAKHRPDTFSVAYSAGENYVYYTTTEAEARNPKKPRSERIIDHVGLLHVVDARDGEAVAKVRLGYDVTPFFVNADNEAVYLSSRIQREGVGATLWRIHDGNVGMYRQSVESCKPQYSLVNETRKFATIVCRNKAIHFAPDKTLISKSPFRPRTAYYDKTADRIFMLEQYGSEVAILPLDPSAAPVRESTGRGGIKVAQSVGAVTLGVATMFATGGTLVAAPFPSYRHTSMVSDANAGRLYALNKGTRDVTIFRTADLKRLKSFAVGHNPTTLVRSAHSPYVLALAPSQITVLHTATDEQVLVEKGGKLVEALDGLDRFYFADTSGMRIYSISELAVVAEHAAFANAYSVVAPRPEP